MATVVETGNLLKDAALIVDVCFSVEEGDVVTIICDDDREDEARAVAEVVCRARRVARDHEQRDAGAARPRGRALPDGAARATCTGRWSAPTR